MTCGLPGAGKSTLLRAISLPIDTLLEYDALELSKHNYAAKRTQIFETAQLAASKLRDNEILFVDDNMYYKSMRKQYRQLAARLRLRFCILFFDCSLQHCQRNNALRSDRQEPRAVIDRMHDKLESPLLQSAEKRFVLLASENTTRADVAAAAALIDNNNNNNNNSNNADGSKAPPTAGQSAADRREQAMRGIIARTMKQLARVKHPQMGAWLEHMQQLKQAKRAEQLARFSQQCLSELIQ